MQLKRREALRGLRKLGTIEQGGNHEKCRVIVDGKKIATFPIPSNDDYNDTLVHFVASPLCLDKHAFSDVCDCTKDKQWYRDHLAREGKL
jgi:hypothetical protein